MPSHPLLIWTSPDAATFASRVVAHLGAEVVGLGVPATLLREDEDPVRTAFPALTPTTDLRQLVVESSGNSGTPALLLFSDVGITRPSRTGAPGEMSERELIALTGERGARLLTLSPLPSLAMPDPPTHVRTLPRFVDAPSFGTMRDILHDAGDDAAVRTLAITARASGVLGSLGRELLDACLTVERLLGTPDSVDAAFVGPAGKGAVHLAAPEPNDGLRGLHGDLIALCRYGGPRGATIHLSASRVQSERGPALFRGVMATTARATMRMTGSSIEHADESSSEIDRESFDGFDVPEAVVAHGIERALTGQQAGSPEHLEWAMYTAGAALLAARTAQPESPATLRKMRKLSAIVG